MLENCINKINENDNKIKLMFGLVEKELIKENITLEGYAMFKKLMCMYFYQLGVVEGLAERITTCINTINLSSDRFIPEAFEIPTNQIKLDIGGV